VSARDNQDDVGLSCNLAALDETQQRRRALLAEWLQVGTVDISDDPDGYAFHLDPVSLAARHIDEFAALERLCCPFLTLKVRPGHGDSGPVLEIGGGQKIEAFVASQFGIRGDTGHAG
jgi:hypothetical protein